MFEILVWVLVLTNIATVVAFVRSSRKAAQGSDLKYNIVEFWGGEVLQGPLDLRKAQRAQRKWDQLFVFDGGPRTNIVVAR